jgi:hypothetical protein
LAQLKSKITSAAYPQQERLMQELKVRLSRRDKIQEWSVEINNEFYGMVAQEEVPKFLMQMAIDTQVPFLDKLTRRLQ